MGSQHRQARSLGSVVLTLTSCLSSVQFEREEWMVFGMARPQHMAERGKIPEAIE